LPLTAPAGYDDDEALSAAISTMVVKVLTDCTGREPTGSRTHLSDELVCVVVHDALTRAERSLVDNGNTDLVLRERRAFQAIMRAELVAGIEALTGREVIAFFGDNSIAPDITIESFLLTLDNVVTSQPRPRRRRRKQPD
jgi:uncharacterized protein YbcI